MCRGMELFRAERVFRVWDYSVSHSMLLLSSVGNPPGAPQIDVEFGFVNALKLPSQLQSLLVRDPYLDELSVLGPEVESVCPWAFATGPDRIDHRLFVLDAGDQVGWVLASGGMIAGPYPRADPLLKRTGWSPDSVYVTASYVGRSADRGAHHMWWDDRRLRRWRSGAEQLRRILLKEWDPLRVRNTPEAANKYDAYLGQIASRLSAGASAQDIAAFLGDVEEVRMGLVPSAATRKRNEALAARLRVWYDKAIRAERRADGW